MSENNTPKNSRTELIAGLGLVLIGIVFLLNNFFDFRFEDVFWPFFVIIPGLLIFAFSLSLSGEGGSGLAILGSMISMVGLLLFYQNTFDHFESWAYAWALVVPTSVGLGQVLYGSLKRLPDLVETGRRTVVIGVAIFAIGAFFFEVILGISGILSAYREFLWPVLLIGLGVYVLFRNLRRGRNPETGAARAVEEPEPVDQDEPA